MFRGHIHMYHRNYRENGNSILTGEKGQLWAKEHYFEGSGNTMVSSLHSLQSRGWAMRALKQYQCVF